ncbi:MAG: hypothetical protein AVDCRST_MAG49-140, partial [uncultured Thermomicrobiales bacterium]
CAARTGGPATGSSGEPGEPGSRENARPTCRRWASAARHRPLAG